MLFRPLLLPALVSVQRQATQQATVRPILPVRLMRMCKSKCQVQRVGIGEGGYVTQCPIHFSAGMFLGEFTLLEPHQLLQYALSCPSGLHSLKPGVSGCPS